MNTPHAIPSRQFTLAGLRIPVLLAVLTVARVALGQEERLFEREPFDRITLLGSNGQPQSLDVLPVKPPDEDLPPSPPGDSILRVRLVDQPDTEYQVAWSDIRKIERFQEMVLAEANRLVAAGKFDDAYDDFAFLQQHYPRTSGLSASAEAYLMNNAFASFRERRYDEALALLAELHRLNPSTAGLDNALSQVTDKLIESHVSDGDYQAARAILQSAERRDPEAVPAAIAAWRQRMRAAAEKERAVAQQRLAAGQARGAYEASRKMLAIWPQLEGAEDLLRQVTDTYPLVVVGVMQPGQPCPPARRLGNRPARRVARLLQRMLVERVATASEDARYMAPLGRIAVSPDHQTLKLELRGVPHDQGLPNAFDLSQRMLSMADPQRPEYDPLIGHRIGQVTVTDGSRWEIRLRQPHFRAQALLLDVLPGLPDSAASSATRPYHMEAVDATSTQFTLHADYVLARPTQPKAIIERRFDDPLLALKALGRGDIDVLDRVYPWQLPRLRNDSQVTVGRYDDPSIHVLVPSTQQPPLSSRTFRRALTYAINREAILQRQILTGQQIEGCRVISGPLPAGASPDDPRGYAYDPQIKPLAYDPRLAWALLRAAEAEYRDSSPDTAIEDTARTLVLAHPADELVRGACESIQRQLQIVGVSVTLRELAPGQYDDRAGEYDLLYGEWVLPEPVVDVWHLLGPGGFLSHATPHLKLPLRRVDRATNWPGVRQGLREMHRIAHDETSVVPLWQLVDFFAFRRNVEGVGERPDGLYSNVEDWQLRAWIPREGGTE